MGLKNREPSMPSDVRFVKPDESVCRDSFRIVAHLPRIGSHYPIAVRKVAPEVALDGAQSVSCGPARPSAGIDAGRWLLSHFGG